MNSAISEADIPAGSIGPTQLEPTAVTAGSYTGADITVDADGRLTAASTGTLRSRASAQFDKTNTTLADVTGLSVSVLALATYAISAELYLTTDSVGSAKFSIAGTATTSAVVFNLSYVDTGTGYGIVRGTALGASLSGTAGDTVSHANITGTITIANAGTLTVQFAQLAASGTSSVLVGSTFIARRIA